MVVPAEDNVGFAPRQDKGNFIFAHPNFDTKPVVTARSSMDALYGGLIRELRLNLEGQFG